MARRKTQAPDTQAPDTQAPDTQAPDTQAPDTQAPDTQAPDTQAPDTAALAFDPRAVFAFNTARQSRMTQAQFMDTYASDVRDPMRAENARNIFMAAWITAVLHPAETVLTAPLMVRGEVVRSLPNVNAKVTEKRPVKRDDVQERAYGAARAAWFYYLDKCGLRVKSDRPTKQAGDVNKTTAATTAATTAPSSPVTAPETAKYTTVAHGHKYLSQCAATMLATMDKHAPAFDTNLRKMVTDFASHLAAYVVAE